MITLRIQEILQKQELSLEELSNRLELSQENLQLYMTTQPFSLTEEVASILRSIAIALRLPVVSLLKPIPGQEIFRLAILELSQRRGIRLDELSALSQVPHTALVFYCTQAFAAKNLNKMPFSEHIRSILKALSCTLQDLKYEVEIPVPGKIAEFADSRGTDLEELSILADLSIEFLEVLSVQYPENFVVLTTKETPPVCDICCPVQHLISCPEYCKC